MYLMNYTEDMIPNYSFMFSFEKNFNAFEAKTWIVQNRIHTFCVSAIYVIAIFGGRYLMSNRPRFVLRGPLILWNLGLSIFSITGFLRSFWEMLHSMQKFGYYHSVCISSYIQYDPVSSFWTWMFALSKVVELGDTVFLVLRKQPVIFLHWYHHITVFIYTWYAYSESAAGGRWFTVINLFVHSIMYSYYTLTAMSLRPPKWISILVTMLQICQMIMGIVVNISTIKYLQNGIVCFHSRRIATFGLLMYFSYFLLFLKFFRDAYVKDGYSKKREKKDYVNGTEKNEKLKAN